jgi:retron-type reverse transcriptase
MFEWLVQWFRPKSKPETPPSREAPAAAEPGVILVSAFNNPPVVDPGAASPAAPSATPPPPIPQVAKLKLDAADFLPISRQELLEAGRQQGRGWFGNVWFGRRDLIPPADDPRTKMVDRGLVNNGLLTPDQLVEIHTVGAERERYRPQIEMIQHTAALAGQQAVEADRARRAALKEQKKKEAAERRQRRAEAIRDRKATDILFLGRGVSGQLGERDSDAPRLQAAGLPVLSTPADVAEALGLTIPQLRWLAFHAEVATRTHYVYFTVPKKSGGLRTLSAPHRKLAAAQRWIHDHILSKLLAEPAAQGFRKGCSTVTNARPHCQQALVVNMDLENFFPSIVFPRVRSVFQRLGYSPCVATVLALLCTECPRRQVTYDGKAYWVAIGPRGLPQGACTSPALANQVARRLDKRLGGLAKKLALAYTRYADDLTFSGAAELEPRVGYLLARVRHLAEAEGFTVNGKKTRILRRSTAQKVTGLVVNDKPAVPRRELRRLRALLHRARYEGLDQQYRHAQPNFRSYLEGKIAYIRMVQPQVGAKLLEQYEALPRAGDQHKDI